MVREREMLFRVHRLRSVPCVFPSTLVNGTVRLGRCRQDAGGGYPPQRSKGGATGLGPGAEDMSGGGYPPPASEKMQA
jgi:hypothetical protein